MTMALAPSLKIELQIYEFLTLPATASLSCVSLDIRARVAEHYRNLLVDRFINCRQKTRQQTAQMQMPELTWRIANECMCAVCHRVDSTGSFVYGRDQCSDYFCHRCLNEFCKQCESPNCHMWRPRYYMCQQQACSYQPRCCMATLCGQRDDYLQRCKVWHGPKQHKIKPRGRRLEIERHLQYMPLVANGWANNKNVHPLSNAPYTEFRLVVAHCRLHRLLKLRSVGSC